MRNSGQIQLHVKRPQTEQTALFKAGKGDITMHSTLAPRCMSRLTPMLVVLLVSASSGALHGQVTKNSEELTTEAWADFNKADFKGAIAKAQECIRNFKDDADDKEEELRKKNTPEPATDQFSAAERDAIMKRGPLNDVATSFFIIGQSEEELYRRGKEKDPGLNQSAKEAYQQACKYTYARTWDPSGFFWSPSKKACRLAQAL